MEVCGGCSHILQPVRSWHKNDPDYTYIRIRNYGCDPCGVLFTLGFVAIHIDTDDPCDGSADRTYHATKPATQLTYMGSPIPGSKVWWQAGSTQVTVRIPVDHWSDCCEDWCYKWEIGCDHAPPISLNIADDWIDDPCDCDMYPAEVKKFMEIYKWHDPITEDDITDEIYCEDFEDPCVVHDNFDAIDVNADGDTWILTDKRSHSPDHSFHNTQHDEYMPNAHDMLEFNMGGPGLDVSGYDELKVEFWHWMQGDFVDPNIIDYGYVEYKTNIADPWTFADGLFYDNDWELVTFTISVYMSELMFRIMTFIKCL
jgi:hypothetical protein